MEPDQFRLLFVAEETAEGITEALSYFRAKKRYAVLVCPSKASLKDALEGGEPDALVYDAACDILGPEALFSLLCAFERTCPVVALVSGDREAARRLSSLGASEIFEKPAAPEELENRLVEFAEQDALRPSTFAGIPPHLQSYFSTTQPAGGRSRENSGRLMGISPAMQALYTLIESAAHSAEPVFVSGETGSGKSAVAHAVFRHGARPNERLMTVDCRASGKTQGAFAARLKFAEAGAAAGRPLTILLDEVSELTDADQALLSGFLARHAESSLIRTICTSSSNMNKLIHDGRYRLDLFFRLHVLHIGVPPLRERGEDVLDIALACLRRFSRKVGKAFSRFEPSAEAAIAAYSWPGNVRELENAVMHGVGLFNGVFFTVAMLPPYIREALGATSSASVHGRS